jgi:mono/diheme cytochrome c family protein
LLTLFLVLGCLQGGEELKETKPSRASSVAVPEGMRSLQNPIPSTESSLTEGKRTYSIYCKTCHGLDGEGGQRVTQGFEYPPADLTRPEVRRRTDGELFYFISEGVNGTEMLPWEDLLTDERRWHLVNYIRSLQEAS